MSKKRPIVLISTHVFDYNGSPGHVVRDTYIRNLVDICGAVPLALPCIGSDFNLAEVKDVISGIVLTGSVSNIAPGCYGGGAQQFDDRYLDIARDRTALPLIRGAMDADIPLLAVCRGFQEMNVAFGGTLHQKVHDIPGNMDHRQPQGLSLAESYERRAHAVSVEEGGVLSRIGAPARFDINSIHEQGIDKLGNGLRVEARADDGLIEAISMPGKTFALGVQWHPEADTHISAVSRQIFSAFGAVLAERRSA